MARGTSQAQSASSATSRPGVMAPRGSAAATAGMRRRRLTGGSNSSAGATAGSGPGNNMLRFYTDESPGLKITPTAVLVMSVCFIGFVTALHVFASSTAPKLALAFRFPIISPTLIVLLRLQTPMEQFSFSF